MKKEMMEKSHKSVKRLWNSYLAENPQFLAKDLPPSFYFCDNEKDANECAELVIKGIKKATATSLWWYEKNSESLPNVGDQYIVTDWNGAAKVIIETTKVEYVPYCKIISDFAEVEGEGDKSLEYWKRVHEPYYKREMKPYDACFDQKMIIVCEYFKTIHFYKVA